MKILCYKIDRNIDALVRQYGISDVARRIGVSASFMTQVLQGKCAISEKNYEKIKEIVNE